MLTLPKTKDQLLYLIDQLSKAEKSEILNLINQQQDDPDDTPDEVAIAGIRQGFQEALSGQLIPLAQMWEGIDIDIL
ncbi:MAG: hypothetical protein ACO3EZ_01810 [Prochlorotrichaceae cyanobacterium]